MLLCYYPVLLSQYLFCSVSVKVLSLNLSQGAFLVGQDLKPSILNLARGVTSAGRLGTIISSQVASSVKSLGTFIMISFALP